MKSVVLTGAGGAMGRRVLAALGRRPEIERICLLGPVWLAEQGRTRACAAMAVGNAEVRRVAGDLRAPRFGLDEVAFVALGEGTDVVIHCAERSRLDGDLGASRADNVKPLETLVELLRWNGRTRLVHLSTAWVAGTRRGLFTEFDLACGQRFCNAFEQSKYEAECLLRDSEVAERVTIVRRSLTIDETGPAGETDESPLVPLLGRIARGQRTLIAGDPLAHLDLVPLGHVAEAVVALAGHPAAAGKTLHLVAGWPHSRPLGELVELARSLHRGEGNATVRFVPPALAFLVRRLRPLAPYLRQRCIFDDFLARELLEPLGLSCPAPEAYLAQALGSLAAVLAPSWARPSEKETARVEGLPSAASSGHPTGSSILS